MIWIPTGSALAQRGGGRKMREPLRVRSHLWW